MNQGKKLSLLVMAAGMGSRYGGIKQIDGFGPNGETIMDYSLFDAIRSGFSKIVFVVREEILDAVKEMFLPKLEGKAEVHFVIQSLDKFVPDQFKPVDRTKPWGTAHAVLAAESVVREPFLMINADDFYGQDAFAKIAADLTAPRAQDGRSHYSMVGFYLKNTLSEHGSVARGVCTRGADGMLASVTEMTKIFKTPSGAENRETEPPLPLTGEEVVSMNFFGFTPDIFGHLRAAFVEFLNANAGDLKAECYVPKVVDSLIQAGKADVRVLESNDSWFGVTYPEDKADVVASIRALVAAGRYPENLRA